MDKNKLIEVIKNARDTKKRNFKQSFDLAINLKNIDLKKPENKIKTEVKLPQGTGKVGKVGVIVDSLFSQTKGIENIVVIKKDQLEGFAKNKKEAKKIVKECKYFVAEAPLMPTVGRVLGPILAPKNLMPTPVPVTANIAGLIETKFGVLKISLKDSPSIHVPIGTEDMDDATVADNADAIIKNVLTKLPKGKEQIKDFVIKLTMGKPITFKM